MKIFSTKYDRLIQQHKNNIYGYCFLLLKNRMDADDVTQQVFIKIWENMDSINYFSSKSWIMRITHNLCVDFIRKRNIISGREKELWDEVNTNLQNRIFNPEVNYNSNEIGNIIKGKIDLLTNPLKDVFVLFEIQGLKYKEISSVLEIPINSVKVYLLRARKQLQEKLKGLKINEQN